MEFNKKINQMIRRGKKDGRIVIRDSEFVEVENIHIADYRDIRKDLLHAECGDLRGGSAMMTFDHYKTVYYIKIEGASNGKRN